MSTSNTGFNFSGYPQALVNRINKFNKLQYDHYLMSYAVTNSGLSNFNKNYKVPVHALREDFKSYIGFENAKGQWRQLTRLWFGDWYKENEVQNNNETVKTGDKVNSYLYNWSLKELGHDDYILNKFGDETYEGHEDKIPTERVFIVKNAPIPCEYNYATLFVKRDKYGNPIKDAADKFILIEVNEDPYPHLTKIVDKNYIDNRFNGVRIVNADNTVGEENVITDYKYSDDALIEQNVNTDSSVQDYPIDFGDADTAFLRIRPYTCVYEFTKHVKCIHLYDDLDCGNGKTTRDSLIPEARDGKDSQPESNLLTFFIKIPKPTGIDAEAIDKQGIVFLANDNVIEREVAEKDQEQTSENQITKKEKYTPSVRWSFLGERHRVLKQAWIADRDVLIKCEAHYTTDEESGKKILNILCSSAVNYDQGISVPEYITGYACNDFRHHYTNRFASSNLLYKHTFSDGVGENSILDDFWDVNDEDKGTYASNVNSIHVSPKDREKWDSHVDDVDKGSMLITSSDDFATHHFAKGEKADWLEEIYDRVQLIDVDTNSDNYISIELTRKSYDPGTTNPDTEGEGDSTNTEGTDNSSTTTPDESGVATVSLTETGSQYVPSPKKKVAYIKLNTTDVMLLGKPSDAAIPTTHALYAHAFDWREGVDGEKIEPNSVTYQPLHVTQHEKDKWNSFSNLEAGHCIHISDSTENNVKNINVLTVKSAEEIKNADKNIMATTVPTTGAVKAYAAGAGGIQYEDKKENEDEAPKSTNFRFLGAHVHQVVETDENGKPLVKLYFGPNNNPPAIGAIESPTSTAMYLYYSDSNSSRYKNYKLPDGFEPTTDDTYDCVFKTGEKFDTIRIKGVDKNKVTDDFIIPVVLPTNETEIKQNTNCIRVDLIHKTPSGDSTSTVNLSLPIKIDSVTKKYVFGENGEIKKYEKDGKLYISSTIQNGLQITLEDPVINQKEDANDGYLPDVVRTKGFVSINSSLVNGENTALQDVGSYELRVTTNNGEAISEKQIFVYEDMIDATDYEYDESDGEMTSEVIFNGGGTKWVSGIEYYKSATMNVTVDNIRYTQPYVTKDTNRIKLKWGTPGSNIITSGINNNSSADVVIKKGEELKPKEQTDTGLTVSSVFRYTSASGKHNITSSGDVGNFSLTLENVHIYKQDGNTLPASLSNASVKTATSDKPIWTHSSSKPNDYTITFNADNDVNGNTTYYRYLNTFNKDTGEFNLFDLNTKKFNLTSDIVNPEGGIYNFDSKQSLNNDAYENELLVQGGWLKHPSKDETPAYKGATGVKCYVRRIKIDSSSVDALGALKMTVEGMQTAYYITTKTGTSNVNFYLACPGKDKILHLNATNTGDATGNIVRVATSSKLNGTSWQFETYNKETWPIFGKNKKAYYLIVTMNEQAKKIGKITITVA